MVSLHPRLAPTPVTQTSRSAVAQTSKSAVSQTSESAVAQVSKPASHSRTKREAWDTPLTPRWSLIPHLLLLLLLSLTSATAAEPNPLLVQWLNAQTNVQTWSADFTQTRTLKSLARPLTAHGRVWFAEPNRFRWELGDPPETIAVRGTNQLLVIYPMLKRAERYPLDGTQTGQWREVLALLDAGFPRNRADLEARYRVTAVTTSAVGVAEATLQPRSASARRMMPQIRIAFGTNDLSLRATELQFADGSTMRNDFTNAVLNPNIDESRFRPELPADYTVVEPLKQAR